MCVCVRACVCVICVWVCAVCVWCILCLHVCWNKSDLNILGIVEPPIDVPSEVLAHESGIIINRILRNNISYSSAVN